MLVIAIEGNDGTGKSSLIKNLSKYYKAKGYKVLVVRYNMSYTTLPAIKEGKRRKFSPQINTLLHYASIKDQYLQYVKDYINKGYMIIWDRYIYSVCARGVDEKAIKYYLKDVPSVDSVIYLDLDPIIAYERLSGDVNYWESGLDVYIDTDKNKSFVKFQNRVRCEFDSLLSDVENLEIIDASNKKQIIFSEVVSFLNNLEV